MEVSALVWLHSDFAPAKSDPGCAPTAGASGSAPAHLAARPHNWMGSNGTAGDGGRAGGRAGVLQGDTAAVLGRGEGYSYSDGECVAGCSGLHGLLPTSALQEGTAGFVAFDKGRMRRPCGHGGNGVCVCGVASAFDARVSLVDMEIVRPGWGVSWISTDGERNIRGGHSTYVSVSPTSLTD